MKLVKNAITVIICMVLGAACMFFGLQYGMPQFAMLTGKTTIDLEVLQESMERNNELSTAEYLYTAAVPVSDQNVLDLSDAGLGEVTMPFTESTYIFQFDGTIKAGFDLSEAEFSLEDSGNTIVVTLGEPKVLSHETGEVSTTWERQSVCNPLHAGEESSWIRSQKKEMEMRAQNQGLFDEAREYAKVTFAALFDEVLPEGVHLEVRFR